MERWKPEIGEKYWFVNACGAVTKKLVSSTVNHGLDFDSMMIECSNCFRTQEKAEAAAEKIKKLLLSLHEEEQPTTNCNQLPKLTAEVFDRPDCPVDAKIAVVNENGSAYWGSFNTARQNFRGGWDGENGSWFSIPGKWDASDWQNSLIERPSKAAFDKLLKNCAEQQANKILQKAREHRLSEQYHNGPEKTTLPNWCKQGKWIYYTTPGELKKAYGQISEIEKHDSGTFILFIKGRNYGVSYDSENMSQAIVRSWSFEEAPYHLKVKKKDWTKADEELAFISGRSGKWGYLVGANISECLRFYSLEEMQIQYSTLDGSPCGVLEHLENGEWVE